MSYLTTEVLHRPAALLYYSIMAPPFTINKPISEAILSPLMTRTHTFYNTHPMGHQISVMLRLPNNPYQCKYQAFQYVKLWQELQLATAQHDPPLPDVTLANL